MFDEQTKILFLITLDGLDFDHTCKSLLLMPTGLVNVLPSSSLSSSAFTIRGLNSFAC